MKEIQTKPLLRTGCLHQIHHRDVMFGYKTWILTSINFYDIFCSFFFLFFFLFVHLKFIGTTISVQPNHLVHSKKKKKCASNTLFGFVFGCRSQIRYDSFQLKQIGQSEEFSMCLVLNFENTHCTHMRVD